MVFTAFGVVIPVASSATPVTAGANDSDTRDSTMIGRGAFFFDTALGEPLLPSQLLADFRLFPEYDTYILQFTGPIYGDSISEIQSLGVEVFDYLPNFAFIVAASPETLSKVAALPYVRWIGIYQPAYKLDRELLAWSDSRAIVAIDLFPSWTTDRVLATIDSAGGATLSREKLGAIITIVANVPSFVLFPLARLPEVSWIQPVLVGAFTNDQATWVIQTNRSTPPPDPRRIHAIGITGSNQILTLADTGLDTCHEMFRNDFIASCSDASQPGPNQPGPNHRKVFAYLRPLGACADWVDSGVVSHGTRTSGTVAGDAPTIGVYDVSTHDGHAFGGKVIMQDLENIMYTEPTCAGSRCYSGTCIPSNLITYVWQPSFDLGSRIHSNSWGPGNQQPPAGSPGYYCDWARQADQFTWDHPTFLVLFSAGNEGSGLDTIRCTGAAKDIITVGGTQNGAGSYNIADFSSRGPTDDGRIKPTIVAPAQDIWSARPGVTPPYSSSSGNSFSTPAVAGGAALVRQYFMAGWYPTGSQDSANSRTPSAALVKAIIVNGAVEIGGNGAYANGESRYPNDNQGWGRVHLDNALYFQGDTRVLSVLSNDTRLTTGQVARYEVTVSGQSEPIEVTLVWSDHPAAVGAAKTLVNDLDLLVKSPDGSTYKGNVFSGRSPGQSTTGGTFDAVNVEESVLRFSPATGTWTIEVTGHVVPNGPQPFALVVTGALSSAQPFPTGSIVPNVQTAYYNAACSPPPSSWFQGQVSGISDSYYFDWSFGDGTTLRQGPTSSPASTFSHEYPFGVHNYVVQVTVTDSQTGQNLAAVQGTVYTRPAQYC